MFVFTALILYFFYRRFHDWRIEFYEKRYKMFFQEDLAQNTEYSEIDRIETKRRLLFRRKFHFIYSNRENRLLTIIPSSNKKYKELGEMTIMEWLNGRINASSFHQT